MLVEVDSVRDVGPQLLKLIYQVGVNQPVEVPTAGLSGGCVARDVSRVA